jgi:hypothetical protein
LAEEASPVKRSLRLIIVVAVVGLSIGAFFIVKNLPEKQREYTATTTERYELIDSREGNLKSFTFERNDGSTLVFEKVVQGEGDDAVSIWTLASPQVLFEPRERDIRDIAYSVSSISSAQIIEDEPEDLSIYGLDSPSAVATIDFTDGTSTTMYAGNKTPTRNSYYVRVDEDPKVYTVRTYSIDRFFTQLNDLRDRQIAVPDIQAITYFRLESERVMEIVKMEEDDNFIGSQFASLKLAQPYRTERSIDSQRFSEMVETLPTALSIVRFVEDAPQDLKQYDLDPPRYQWIMRDEQSFIHLLVGGDAGEDEVFAKRPADNMVFTLPKSALGFLDTDPFRLADKFVLIPNIDMVDQFTLQGFGKTYVSEIKREKNLSAQEGEDEDVITTYFLGGIEIEEDPFKKFYQLVIGLLMDAENPEPSQLGVPDVTVSYEFNDEAPIDRAEANFVELSHDFYAVYLDGPSDFLLSSYQINAMFDRAAELTE